MNNVISNTKFKQLYLVGFISTIFGSTFAWADVEIINRTPLDSLKKERNDFSIVYALSDDGTVAAGASNKHDNDKTINESNAVIWTGNDWKDKKDLGNLRNSDSGFSTVYALSKDGKIAAGISESSSGVRRATVWFGQDWKEKKDLDALGFSQLNASNADGSIVGGLSDFGLGRTHATLWTGKDWQDKKDLGVLNNQHQRAGIKALSADGKIAGGWSGFNMSINDDRAVIWYGDNWQEKKDLGTLKDDNSGRAWVEALSADGKIAGGFAQDNTQEGFFGRAIIWHGNNWQEKKDLGTLKKDNSGTSSVTALSSNGQIAAGTADDDSDTSRAVIWSGTDWKDKKDLGTLKSDNSGYSIVRALSSDGTVAGGLSYDDKDNERATLWKIAYVTPTNPPSTQPTNPPVTQPTQPTTPTVTPPTTQPTAPVTQPTQPTTQPSTPTTQPTTPVTQPTQPSTPTVTPPTTATPVNPQPTPVVAPVVVAKIDVDNSRQSIQQLGRDTVNMLAQQRDSLQHLHDSCHHGQGTWCYRLEQRFAKNQGNKENSLGLSLGYGISPNLTLGVNYQHGFSRDLPNSFQENGNQQGMGVFARYQQNGWFVEPSLAWNRYRGEIQRPMLSNTESAKHKTRVQGKSVRLTVGQLWQDDDNQQAFSWYTALRHDDVRRPAYQENVEGFPVSYGQARFKETTTAVGMQFQQPLTEQLSWQTRAEVEQRLRGDEPTYTAQADYIGNFQERIKVNRTRASLQTGLRYAFSPSMNVEVAPYVKRGAVGSKTDWGTSLRLQGQF